MTHRTDVTRRFTRAEMAEMRSLSRNDDAETVTSLRAELARYKRWSTICLVTVLAIACSVNYAIIVWG